LSILPHQKALASCDDVVTIQGMDSVNGLDTVWLLDSRVLAKLTIGAGVGFRQIAGS